MKKEQTWLLAAVCLLLFTVSSAGGLGIVWMRQQITKSAAETVKLERKLGEMERKSVYVKAKIAQIDNPTHLREKVRNPLVHPKQQQIVWLDVQGSSIKGNFGVMPGHKREKVITYVRDPKGRGVTG